MSTMTDAPEMNPPEIALSVRQPWAWAIIHCGKDIENRSWQAVNHGLRKRGRIAIHAAKGWTRADIDFAFDLAARDVLPLALHAEPDTDLPRGAILGTVELLSVHRSEQMHPSPLEGELGDYSAGRWVWVLSSPDEFPEPIPARGALGLWEWEA